ncbi:MAG TPA: polyprenyl synthetase family protein, partial [Myxococcota bacterium]|nr:polyprenyl synthetase family protein [Myxococcota bacterium]
IHTYSLVHDDLPCMDDDDERRGRPTVHVAYDEATAVLAGDALLTEAFAALAEGALATGQGERGLLVAAELARAAGAAGLVGGQVDDLLFEAEQTTSGGTDHARLASIHARKTAALFGAAIVGGATLGGANDDERATLAAFARDVGIAFQIADDLLDADSEEAASILRLQGLDDAKRGAEALLDRALARIEGWGERAEPLRRLARFAVRRDR